MLKAKFVGKVRDKNGYAVHLFYKYRGREYMITDEHNGYSQTMAEKHREEQMRIDKEIEMANNTESREEGHFDLGEIFNLIEMYENEM